MDNAQKDFSRLVAYMDGYPDAAVAFSGGTLSALLVCALYEAQGKNGVVLTANTPFFTQEELYCVHEVLDDYPKIRNERISMPDLMDMPQLTGAGRAARCKACAGRVSQRLSQVAKSIGSAVIFDGKTAETGKDGCLLLQQGIQEIQIISPYADLGFIRPDVEEMLKAIGRAYYIRPANHCLACRFSEGLPVAVDGLDYIEAAEKYIRRYTRRGMRVCLDGQKALVWSEESFDGEVRQDIKNKLLKTERPYVTEVIFCEEGHSLEECK